MMPERAHGKGRKFSAHQRRSINPAAVGTSHQMTHGVPCCWTLDVASLLVVARAAQTPVHVALARGSGIFIFGEAWEMPRTLPLSRKIFKSCRRGLWFVDQGSRLYQNFDQSLSLLVDTGCGDNDAHPSRRFCQSRSLDSFKVVLSFVLKHPVDSDRLRNCGAVQFNSSTLDEQTPHSDAHVPHPTPFLSLHTSLAPSSMHSTQLKDIQPQSTPTLDLLLSIVSEEALGICALPQTWNASEPPNQ
jgi:hypothetical protein